MSRRIKILSLVILLIIALILLLLFLFRARPKVTPVEEEAIVVVEEEIPPLVIEPPPPPIELTERLNTASIQSAAKTFAQRYGSYSNESEYANLRDVLPLMTESFATQTQTFIDQARTPEGFYAVTTRIISIEVDELDEEAGQAQLTLSTQREEAIDGPQNLSVRYQTIILTFNKQQGEWKVDSAQWQE